jgi:hypothetical protein
VENNCVIGTLIYKMRSNFNFDVLIFLPQDILSAAPGEDRKWG